MEKPFQLNVEIAKKEITKKISDIANKYNLDYYLLYYILKALYKEVEQMKDNELAALEKEYEESELVVLEKKYKEIKKKASEKDEKKEAKHIDKN